MGRKKMLWDFDPIFWVLDKLTCRIMAVEKQDRYEMSGLYIIYKGNDPESLFEWKTRPANLNNQDIQYHPTTFEVTKDKDQAFQWAKDHSHLPDTNPFREWADYAPQS